MIKGAPSVQMQEVAWAPHAKKASDVQLQVPPDLVWHEEDYEEDPDVRMSGKTLPHPKPTALSS